MIVVSAIITAGSLFHFNLYTENANAGTNNTDNSPATLASLLPSVTDELDNSVIERLGGLRYATANSTITLTVGNNSNNYYLPLAVLPMNITQRFVLNSSQVYVVLEMPIPDTNYTTQGGGPPFFFHVTDETGKKDMLDKTRGLDFRDALIPYRAECNITTTDRSSSNGTATRESSFPFATLSSFVEGEYAEFLLPLGVPVVKARDSNIILVTYPLAALRPINSNNNNNNTNGNSSVSNQEDFTNYYHLKFMTFYYATIKITSNVNIISNTTDICHSHQNIHSKAFYYDLILG